METLPVLATKETATLRSDYPSIEHLEAGNTSSWLQERQDQLLFRAKEERNSMNLAKFITLAVGATGAICYATSPLAPIGAIVAGVGYLWAVVQDLIDTHQFAPAPFIRGDFFKFLSAMGDSELREEYFASNNELAELMLHLEPMEKYEFAMLKQSSHVLCQYLAAVEAGKRFYAYRWLLDWFIQLRGNFPTQEQLSGHLATVTSDPRINYQQVTAILQAVKPTLVGLPETKFATLPPDDNTTCLIPNTEPVISSGDWIQHAIDHFCVLIWGGQRGGKTTAASHIIKARKDRGDRVVILDPHAEKGQWEGLEVIGAGMDYQAIDDFMQWYFEECERRYKLLRAEGRAAVEKLGSTCIVAEELTNYASRCKNSGEFTKASLSDNRKIFFNSLFVSHNRTIATMGNAKGFAQTRDDSFLELHCIPPTGGNARQWAVKYPGGKFSPVDVPNWETIYNFGSASQGDRPMPNAQSNREALEKLWQVTTSSENKPLNNVSEPMNQAGDKAPSTLNQSSETRFTPLNLTKKQFLGLIKTLNNELNQTQLIEKLWQCKKGGSAAWKEAYAQFKELMKELP